MSQVENAIRRERERIAREKKDEEYKKEVAGQYQALADRAAVAGQALKDRARPAALAAYLRAGGTQKGFDANWDEIWEAQAAQAATAHLGKATKPSNLVTFF